MTILETLIQVEAWLFLGAVAAIILHQLVSGGIDIAEAQLSRGQMLISVVAIAAYYLAAVVESAETDKLPSLPTEAIAVLGGSNMIYLANKLAQLWPAITQANHST